MERQKGKPMSKPLAKSLHTVTVLVRMCRMVEHYDMPKPMFSDEQRLEHVIYWLGLSDAPDIHGIKAQALAALSR